MRTPVIKYNFLEHFYIADKETYESILCECLNASEVMVSQFGGKFSVITEQSNGEADVKAEQSGYEIDFKLMISESLKEFQKHAAPVIDEIYPGVKCIAPGKHQQKKILLLSNACRDMTEGKLSSLRGMKDMESKAVLHFFEKVLKKNKNILLFVPAYFKTVDTNLTSEQQQKLIINELSVTTRFIVEFREKNCGSFDTYLVYLESVEQVNYFVIAKFDSDGLLFVDRVRMKDLEIIRSLKEYNEIY